MQNVYQKYQPNLQGLQPNEFQQAAYQNPQAMQGVNTELLKENVQDTYVANRANQMTELNPAQQFAIAIPAWYALCQGMDYFAKKCRGEYKDTIQYKITNAGDVVSDTFKNSKLGKSNFVADINNGFKSLKKLFREKVVNNSAMLRAFADTPSLPELDMVRGQANGMYGIQLFDYPQVCEYFMEGVKHADDLDCYGADKNFINKVKAELSKATTKEARAAILQNAEFELLNKGGVTSTSLSAFKGHDAKTRLDILNNLKAKALGYRDFAHWTTVKSKIQDHLPDVIEATHKANKNMYAKIWSSDKNAWGKIKGHLFGRKVYASEFTNKLLAEMGKVTPGSELDQMLKRTGLDKNIPKSGLGRFFGKYVNLVTEGLTNRVAGGKLVAAIQAWFIAEALIRTAKAEKGDKVATFAERMTEMVAFFAAMPFAIKLMHKIGGLQYAGMTPEQVSKYRDALKIFNEKVKSGFFKDKAAYKAERKVLEETLKGGKHNIFTKLAKRIGRIVTVGLEQIRPYSKHTVEAGITGRIKDVFRNPKYWFKQCAGYPMRIIVGMMMISPFLGKLIIKGTHAIFGKPKNSVLDDGKTEEKQPQQEPTSAEKLAQINQLEMMIKQVRQSGEKLSPEQEAQLQQLEQAIVVAKAQLAQEMGQSPANPAMQTPQTGNSADVGLQNPSNLLDKYKNLNTNANTQQTSEPVRTYIPSPEPVKILNPERSYVPSPMPANLQNVVDTTAADNAMMRADMAEQMAMRALAMK